MEDAVKGLEKVFEKRWDDETLNEGKDNYQDDWSDDSIVYGYAKEPLAKNMLYSYGQDGDYTGIAMYQIGIYNDTYN